MATDFPHRADVEGKESHEGLGLELSKKLDQIQNNLDRSMERTKGVILGDNESVADLRARLMTTRDRALDLLETGEDAVREHPMLMVAGAFAIGVLLGTLFGRATDD